MQYGANLFCLALFGYAFGHSICSTSAYIRQHIANLTADTYSINLLIF